MPYRLKVQVHPLGVVLSDEMGCRELLIETDTCTCGLSFDKLRQIANTTRELELDANDAERWLLHLARKR